MLRKFLEFILLPFELLFRSIVGVFRALKGKEAQKREQRVDPRAGMRGASEKAKVLAFLRGRAHGECDVELLKDVSRNLKVWAITLGQSEVESINRMTDEGALAVISGARAPDLGVRARQRYAEQRPSVVQEFASALDLSAAPAPRVAM